ncbi:caspase family protein [Nannocystis sp. SCPEA4]|uniref:caspase family protein n=1 Tax=Nannocystis sp. SCPEA4 TaxID=2996787 RepID=UPI00226EFE03|nr:caspase family protein [Nannocystis sp. SCPEA4]MCY1059121.1 caspase family protein [Nannocystis sp. SCPEA4]
MHRALIVTANCYARYTPLQYCHVDGHLLRTTLEEWCSYSQGGVISHLRLERTPACATPRALLARICEFAGGAGDGSPFLFYFAGHGLYEERTQASYLLFPDSRPDDLDGTALPMRALRDTLAGLGRPIVQIFDACHSGEAFRGRGPDAAIVPNIRGFVTDLRRNVQRPDQFGWEMLAACDENEASYEDPELQQGVFTHTLAQAIRSAPAGADVQLESLKNVVCPRVRAWAEQCGVSQNPVFAARTFGPLPFAGRNRLTPPKPPTRSQPGAERAVSRHNMTLPVRRDTEIDLGQYVRASPGAAASRLALRVRFEADAVRYELVGAPWLTQTGRRVQPRFHVEPEQVLRGGPYGWQAQQIRCRFDEHHAFITFYDRAGAEVRLSVSIP